MPQTHCFNLPNGLRCAFQQKKSTVAHISIAIKAGSRDELEHQQGLAHFIEHNLFKGTSKRKAYHILSRLDDVGGELNAYTTKEETIVHASFLKTDFRRALDLISDVVFHSTFPEKELEKEKEVIKDEIHSYLDSPSERIFDDFEDFIFKGDAIGRNILGTPQSVDGLSREDILEFQGRTYTAERITISVVGPMSLSRVETMVNEYFGQQTLATNSWDATFDAPHAPESKVESEAQFQDHYMIGWRTPGIHHEHRRALLLLNNILGGPAMNSRLGLNIREKHGIAYNIESFLNLYSDIGMLGIYLGCDPSQTQRAADLAAKEVKKLMERPLGTLQLSRAKNQFIGQMALGEENGLNASIGAARALLYFGRVNTFEAVAKKINAISAQDLVEAANTYAQPNQAYELIYKKGLSMEFLSDDIHEYIAKHTSQAPEYLNDLERETWLKVLMPRMLSGHVQGHILKMFSTMMRPKYILEVGTYTGYASHFLVEGLRTDGEFHAVEINEELETIIKKYWAYHPKFEQMHLHIGPANELLPSIKKPWDLVFLDADKEGLQTYYEVLIPMMPSGAIMLIDNILWSGKVVGGPNSNDKDTKAIVALNEHVANDPRVEQVILSVRDGIMMARKL